MGALEGGGLAAAIGALEGGLVAAGETLAGIFSAITAPAWVLPALAALPLGVMLWADSQLEHLTPEQAKQKADRADSEHWQALSNTADSTTPANANEKLLTGMEFLGEAAFRKDESRGQVKEDVDAERAGVMAGLQSVARGFAMWFSPYGAVECAR